jgi:SsrA-binding protein
MRTSERSAPGLAPIPGSGEDGEMGPGAIDQVHMSKKNNDSSRGGVIAVNKRARFDYHVDERLEAGIALEGWEVKSLRDGRIQFGESYALIKNGEAYLFGAQITPLISASTHVVADKMRNRKLLLHKAELNRLIGAVERKGYTVIPLSLYWKGNRVKVELGLAKGKKEHDKRDAEKERDWQRDKGRIMRERNR